MTDSVDTYVGAWNEADSAARRVLLERCSTEVVELIDENGRLNGYEALGALIAAFHEKVPGARVVRSSGIDEFGGIARYSWDIVTGDGTTVMVGLDVVEHATDGRLQRIIMFHRALPPLDT